MKTIKWVILFVFVAFAYTVSAQADLMIKVTNVRSDCGKVMIATDKGNIIWWMLKVLKRFSN